MQTHLSSGLLRIFFGLALGFIAVTLSAPASGADVETIVFLRHGEKLPDGLGQLSPAGLQRADALPQVLVKKFGTPGYIFAPNPADQKDDDGVLYSYVRPLATIEPTAVACHLPINTQIGYKDISSLEEELLKSRYQKSLIFVAWEHHSIEAAVRDLVTHFGGDAKSVPKWKSDDFDSLYIVRITDGKALDFSVSQEGLNGLVEKKSSF